MPFTCSSSARGAGTAKADKDRRQASTLLLAMVLLRREQDVADAWMEAWDRGPAWRQAMDASLKTFDEETLAQVRIGVARGVKSLGGDPTDYGL